MWNSSRLRSSKKPAFTLIVALIFALVGFALAGATLFFYESYQGRSESYMEKQYEYSALQGAIEAGRIYIAAKGYPRVSATATITNPEDLIPSELKNYVYTADVKGKQVQVAVEIYDSLFNGADARFNTVRGNAAKAKKMPPLLMPTNTQLEKMGLTSTDRLRIYTLRSYFKPKRRGSRGLELVTTIVTPLTP